MTAVSPWIALLALGTPSPEQRLIESLVDLTNDARAKHQSRSLTWDDSAARVARAHADDMAAKDYFDHISPEGTTLADRAFAGGISVFRAVGENLGKGSRDPKTMMRLWMESGGHRRNILDRRFTHIGIGLSTGPRGDQSVWCVVFVAK